VGWREFIEMICPTGEAKYFCKGDSTQKCPTGKSHGGKKDVDGRDIGERKRRRPSDGYARP
jgi:hypothetical protein